MKKIYSILLAFAAILVFSPVLHAQAWKYTDNGNGVAYKKTISEPTDQGIYTITLESFVLGQVTVEQKTMPADIVLVLDYSNSMNQNMSSYTARDSQPYSYSTYGNNTYYYLHTDGNYYAVSLDGRRLRFNVGTGWNADYWYLYGESAQHERPAQVANNNTTIWTGVLYTQTQETKLHALQEAVVTFVQNIKANNTTLGLQEGEMGNRIAFVLYDRSVYDGTGRNALIEVDNLTASGTSVNYSGSNVLQSRNSSGTNTREAMGMARDILDAVKTQENRTRAVVMFTDGSPTHYGMSGETWDDDVSGDPGNFSRTIANGCISNAYYIKNTIKAPVYAVGLFDGDDQSDLVKTYMEYTSSDFPDKSALPDDSEFLSYSENYGDYCMIVSPEMSLDDIFDTISEQTGGSGNTSMSSAVTAVDVVSASFVLPGANDPDATDEEILSNVTVSLAPCTGQREETYTVTEKNPTTGVEEEVTKHYLEFGTPVAKGDTVTVALSKGTGSNKRNAISVNGFDYSYNWCGPVSDGTTTTWHGYKVIITIDIEMDPDATGGPNVETNGPGSGITTIIDGEPVSVVEFKSPTVSLPVNIFINKLGLDEGESAKFLIERALLPDDWEKPASSTSTAYNSLSWEPVTSVFVTKHEGESDDDVITKVVGLPATKTVNGVQKEFVYRVVEQDWSWSYSSTALTPVTTDQLVTNPFKFQNTKKDGIDTKVRHAESKATNTFHPDKQNVKYDDSKDNGRSSSASGGGTGGGDATKR